MALENLKIAVGFAADHQFYENYGAAWSCGLNTNGQLGLGDTSPYTTPQQLPGYVWDKFAVGQNTTFAVKTDGTLWSCGRGDSGALGYPLAGNQTTFAQIGSATDWADVVAGGQENGYALKTTGEVYSWGTNTYGQLGIGTTGGGIHTPQATGLLVAQLASGDKWSAAIKTDGTLWTWGLNTNGQLGQNDTAVRSTPTQVGSGTTWLQVAAGQSHAAAIKTDGTLWAWGVNTNGQLGVGDTTQRLEPTQVGTDTTWVEVQCAYYTTYARKSDGTIWAWGKNDASQAVQGDATQDTSPDQIGTGTAWTKIWADGADLYAFTGDSVYVGGSNWSGSIGIGNTTAQPNLVAQNVSFDTPSAPLNLAESISVSGDALVSDIQNNQAFSDAATTADTLADSTFTMYLEAVGLADSLAADANTTAALTDSAVMLDVIQQAINQIVADSADGADTLNLGAALTLVDIANAVATQTPTYNSVLLVAELIATLEAYNGADAYDVTESGALSDAYVARVEALVTMLETAQAVDTNTALIRVMQAATDTADGGETITSAGSLLNALLNDAVLATIRISIGGEVFTGWVLNTDTMAPSEYQFADLQFNSACKHGTRYLMAADDGIYEFTNDTGVETVMTYIKTGKTDFGSDLKKRIVNAYVVYSASAQMVLKVTTSEFGNLVTRNYRMTPQADDTTDARRVDIGKGVKSRYWQFEVVGDGVDCDIDEIGMLPIVLSRRI